MDIEDLTAAAHTASWLADRMSEYTMEASKIAPESEDARKAVQQHLLLRMAQLSLVEFAANLSKGMSEEDALRATVRGESKVDPKFAAEWDATYRKKGQH